MIIRQLVTLFLLVICTNVSSAEEKNCQNPDPLKALRNTFEIKEDTLITAKKKKYRPYPFESKFHSDLAYVLKDMEQAKIIYNAYKHHILPITLKLTEPEKSEEKAFISALLEICLLFGNPKYSPLDSFLSALQHQGIHGKRWVEEHLQEVTLFTEEANTSIYSDIETNKDLFTVVVLTTSCSGGNLSVANALTEHLSKQKDIRVIQVDTENVAREEDPMLSATGSLTYDQIYSAIFQKTNNFNVIPGRKELSKEIHRYIPSNFLRVLKQKVSSLNPDLIISTRSYTVDDIALASLGVPFRMMQSDFELCPSLKSYYRKVNPSSIRFWLYNEHPSMFKPLFEAYNSLDLYDVKDTCTSIKKKVSQLLDTPLELIEKQFEVIGCPTSTDFFHIEDQEVLANLRKKWKIDNNEMPVFILMGKHSTAALKEIFNTLLNSKTELPIKYLFLCGTNTKLKRDLETILAEKKNTSVDRFTIYGLLSPKEINEIMNISYMGISKAGAASITEIMATQGYAILMNTYPWEEVNASYLIDMGCAVHFNPSKPLINQIEKCLMSIRKKTSFDLENWEENLIQQINILSLEKQNSFILDERLALEK
jgi:UDP-N-acetylglucosamine:LPS N-acetylglucosamine transferase